MARLTKKEYRLADDRSGLSFTLKTGKKGGLTILDEELGARRAIRHCPNQSSIYRDKQDDYALVEPIVFTFGQLEVDADQPLTQEFLDKHPANVANGGRWFELIDEEQDNLESIRDEELKADILYEVRKMARTEDGLHELSAVVAVLAGSVDEASSLGIEGLKRVIYNAVDADPEYFTDDNGNVTVFEDDTIKRTYIILRAIKEGILKKSSNGKSILWTQDGKVIATAPRSMDLVEYFTDYLTTDDGILVAEEIARRS